jgi:hypothetical protein
MMTAYFDASGDIHKAEALALAWFCASAGVWIEWEREWLERLGEDHLSCFHRNELSGWPHGKRDKLIADLSAIMVGHGLYRFGAAIINHDLKKRTSEEERKSWHVNEYSYAGRCAATEMRNWTASWGGPFPEMVFERGDTGRGRLIDLYRRDGYPEPIFKPKRDYVHPKTGIFERACVPLQAADLYAYDLFSRARDIALGGDVSRDFANGINPAIEKLSGRSGVATPGHIQFMADGLEQRDSLIMTTVVKIDTGKFIR